MFAECTIQYDTKKGENIYVFVQKQILVCILEHQTWISSLGFTAVRDLYILICYLTTREIAYFYLLISLSTMFIV